MSKQKNILPPYLLVSIYAPEDEKIYDQLKQHLIPLEDQGLIIPWSVQQVVPGRDLQQEINLHLDEASIILLLISSRFISSMTCRTQMQYALDLEKKGVRVIPILLSPLDTQGYSFSHSVYLPRNREPVTRWEDPDAALVDVALGIRNVVEDLQGPSPKEPSKVEEELHASRSKDNESRSPVPSQKNPPAPKKKSISMIALTLVAILIILVLIGAGAFFHNIRMGIGNSSSTASSTKSPNVQMRDPVPETPAKAANIVTAKLVQNERASFSLNANTINTKPAIFHNSVVKGDLLIIAITQFEGQVLPLNQSGVTDNENDTYIQIGSAVATSKDNQDYVELYFAPNARGGVTKITVKVSTPQASDVGDLNIGIYEFSGLSIEENTAPNTSDTNLSKSLPPNTLSAGRLSTTGSDDLCFAVAVDSGPFDQNSADNTAVSPGTSYTFPPSDWQGQPDQQEDWQNGERFYTEYDTAVAPGGCNPNFKIYYTASWAIISAAFRP